MAHGNGDVPAQMDAERLGPDQLRSLHATVDVQSLANREAGVGLVVHERAHCLPALDGELVIDAHIEPPRLGGDHLANGEGRSGGVHSEAREVHITAVEEVEEARGAADHQLGPTAIEGEAI